MPRFAVLPFVLAGVSVLLSGPPARAGEMTREKVLAAGAARRDACLNLTRLLYSMSIGGNKTVQDIADAGGAQRDLVEAAVRGAAVVEGPSFDEGGLTHVVVELTTLNLPYDTRLQIRDLPREIRIDGVAWLGGVNASESVPVGEVTDQVKEWAVRTLEADGEAPTQKELTPELLRRAGRAQALANAYTALAKQAWELKLDPNATIKDFVDFHPELRPELNATLVGAELLSESLDPGGAYKVKIALPGRRLLMPLRLGGFRKYPGLMLNAQQVVLARRNARAAAIQYLEDRAYSLPLRQGATVAEFTANRAELRQDISKVCRVAPVDRFEITRDGLAKMYVSIPTASLPRAVTDLLRSGTVDRLSAIGGGLPVEPKKPEEAADAGK